MFLVPCTSADWDQHEVTIALARDEPEKIRGIKARLIAACWCDEAGKRETISAAGIAGLAGKHPAVINRLYAVAERICGDVGPAEKN